MFLKWPLRSTLVSDLFWWIRLNIFKYHPKPSIIFYFNQFLAFFSNASFRRASGSPSLPSPFCFLVDFDYIRPTCPMVIPGTQVNYLSTYFSKWGKEKRKNIDQNELGKNEMTYHWNEMTYYCLNFCFLFKFVLKCS